MVSNISSNESQSSISSNCREHQFSSSRKSLISSEIKILHKPIARRADGTEIINNVTEGSLQASLSNASNFNHCYFPRSLFLRQPIKTNTLSSQLLPCSSPIEQYDKEQVFHLLDQLDNEYSWNDFTAILDQLTSSTVEMQPEKNNALLSSNNEYEDKENSIIIPNLFDRLPLLSDYYTTLTFHIEDSRKISVYTMTIGTVQLSPTCLFPYSILNGRRPLLKCSIQTGFKRIRSQQQKHICHVTAIESLIDIECLEENDIILKVKIIN